MLFNNFFVYKLKQLNNGYKVVSLVLNDTLDGLLSTPSVTQSLAITTETVGNKTVGKSDVFSLSIYTFSVLLTFSLLLHFLVI